LEHLRIEVYPHAIAKLRSKFEKTLSTAGPDVEHAVFGSAPLIADAYGLTKRESEITRLVLRGLSTTEVSQELHITPNTVRDHFKSIFDKVGVRSRRELGGQVFAQHYQPRMAMGHEPNADGWFA